MAFILAGGKIIQDLEKHGALGMYVPLEGGFEGRYQRRLRGAGYSISMISGRGIGDLAAYLTQVYGARPAHLGKKEIRTYFHPPIIQYHLDRLPPKGKGFVLWFYDGSLLTNQELRFLSLLPSREPRVKIVVEVGGGREVHWRPLQQVSADDGAGKVIP
ncbi:NAD(P)H-quinone oxidoreductase subunit N [Leptolyngbya sp. FACHB-261]|uniref:NAD(P)H-quinone oxidoreductase subunit N n=1 Tax=Leptolyngbya sp. FACHB-261 TaxID=2692806 RepID=UPI001686E950|nr:NAD(P)H-quinone oxidoreductase subunit N [Leptolyngbya sp. FACHB-261]MBD2101736.1 NAD(P)H-quinone oxidoreductase subunit N [Leptolyngbya sp. FACHB-261]